MSKETQYLEYARNSESQVLTRRYLAAFKPSSSIKFCQEDVMRNISKLLLVTIASLFTACPAQETPVVPGKLEVKISGLPSATNASVTVTGPASFNQALTVTKTLTGLTAGSYVVAAASVTAGGKNYAASVTGSPVAVSAGGSSSVSVVYAITIPIMGKVVNQVGLPIPSSAGGTITVTAVGNTKSATVGADGGFTLAVGSVPYSAVVIFSSSSGGASSKIAWVFKGLSRTDPTLTLPEIPNFSSSQGFQAQLTGTVSGGAGFASGSKARMLFAYGVPNFNDTTSINANLIEPDPTTGKFSTTVLWNNTNPINGTLHGLQFTLDANNKINSYKGYGKVARQLTGQNPGDAAITQNLTLGTIPTATLSGTVTWPITTGASTYFMGTTWIPNTSDSTFFNLAAPGANGGPGNVKPETFAQAVPVLAGSKYLNLAGVNNPASQQSQEYRQAIAFKYGTPGTALNMDVPSPPNLQQPPTGATGVTNSSNFSWTPFTAGVHVVSFDSNNAPVPGPPTPATSFVSIRVITTASNLTLTDLSALGLDFPKNSAYTWGVTTYAPYSSMDAATGPTGILVPGAGGSLPKSDGSIGAALFRPFTTAP
jgi:hypothetical protein